jgi:hypothetical protein
LGCSEMICVILCRETNEEKTKKIAVAIRPKYSRQISVGKNSLKVLI